MTQKYNGWKNQNTWNVAHWIIDNKLIHSIGCTATDYREFCDLLKEIDSNYYSTPDGIRWDATDLDTKALDKLIANLKA